MSKQPELLPCPCCGGDEVRLDKEMRHDPVNERAKLYWRVGCPACGLQTPRLTNRDSPVKIWNTRIAIVKVKVA